MINTKEKTTINSYFIDACKELGIDYSDFKFEYSTDTHIFPTPYSACEVDYDNKRVFINENWILICKQKNDKYDIPYILMHEARHCYQHLEIDKWKKAKKSPKKVIIHENQTTLKKWDYEIKHYIRNMGDDESRDKNAMQIVEVDAFAYAALMMYKKFNSSELRFNPKAETITLEKFKELGLRYYPEDDFIKQIDIDRICG